MKKRILLDIDEVLCFSGYVELVNEFLGTNYTIDDFTDYYIDEVAIPKDRMKEFNEFVKDKDQYKNPVFIPGAVDAIKRLSKYYDIYPCSDCRHQADLAQSGRIYASKFNLLYKTFTEDEIPTQNYIFTGTKDLFIADIQIDDLVKNLSPHVNMRILFPSYHNKDLSSTELQAKGIIKAGDDYHFGWKVVEEMLMEGISEQKD